MMKLILITIATIIALSINAQTFSEYTSNPPLERVRYCAIALSDIDGDNDNDLLITGANNFSSPTSKLYINDGEGNFSEMANIPFEKVRNSSIAFRDVDGDNDQDVLITGQKVSGGSISKLYINDGLGNFTEKTETPFEGVDSGSVAFSDIDGDGDQDVMITGTGISFNPISKLYLNDGQGNYTENEENSFRGVEESSIAFSDIDGDGDQDVLITGAEANSFYASSTLYLNDGLGNFSEVMDSPFEDVEFGSIAFSDINGDGDQDLMITGANFFTEPISNIYENDGSGKFFKLFGTSFAPVYRSSVAFGDIDGDNDQDIIISGDVGSSPTTKIYKNNTITSLFLETKVVFDLKVHPNPTSNEIMNIWLISEKSGMAKLKLFDLHGRLLAVKNEMIKLGEQSFTFDISNYGKGTYIIQIDDGAKKGNCKFYIQ